MNSTKQCKSCGEKHHAKGLCRKCYNATRPPQIHNIYDKTQKCATNKSCASFLGIYVAEHVLSMVFNDVKIMPPNHNGYDFICNKGMKIDVKAACLTKSHGEYVQWNFSLRRNTMADFFLCLAFNTRNDLDPVHLWLIPGNEINHLMGASIAKSTINKWDNYKLDITKVIDCCNTLKSAP